MSGLVVDTSVLICILLDEPEAVTFVEAVIAHGECAISAATLVEANSVVLNRALPDGERRLNGLVTDLRCEIVSFDQEQMQHAVNAYRTFGKGSGHRAQLNLGDCFTYALARTRNVPLLFKGDDFVHTDIIPALDVMT